MRKGGGRSVFLERKEANKIENSLVGWKMFVGGRRVGVVAVESLLFFFIFGACPLLERFDGVFNRPRC